MKGGSCSHRGFVSGFRGDAQRERADGLTGVLFLAGQGTKYVASKKADKGWVESVRKKECEGRPVCNKARVLFV